MDERFKALRIDTDRLWSRILQMARIGATGNGGCNRQALSDEDRAGRDLFVSWCTEAGLDVRVDQMGNIFAWRPGANTALPAVLTGSHLDTQATGGRFDGVYGVLAGLEVMATLNTHDIRTVAPLVAVSWTNEEGARFVPAMMGSAVFAGALDLHSAWASQDKSGKTFRNELERIEYMGSQEAAAFPIAAAFEVHIEQGPILEGHQRQIGIVTGIQGVRWYDILLCGEECHAGPTPMALRRDPVRCLGPILESCYAMAQDFAPWARMTFGDITISPGTRNTVPGLVKVCLDMRHHQTQTLNLMESRVREIVARHCKSAAVEGKLTEIWHMPATQFDPACIDAVKLASDQLSYRSMEMISGAGHDSLYIATVAPTAMIFVPCANGLSHNEAESATQADLEAGCNVLLHAMLSMAGTQV